MSLYYQSGSTPKNLGGAIALYHNNDVRFDGVSPVSSYETTGLGSVPYNGNDADKAVPGYTFAKNTNTLLSMRSNDNILEAPVLKNASIYPNTVRSIKYIESASTVKVCTSIRAGRFNIYTGKFDVGFPVTSSDSFGNDNAARSSYAVPGSLTFMVNSKHITTQNYPAKG